MVADTIHTKNMDPSLIRCEVWNPYSVALHFKIREDMIGYLHNNGRQILKREFTLSPGKAILLSHQYWLIESATGVKQPFLPLNLGKDIGKGIRWEPGPKDNGYLDWLKIKKTVNNG